ncbi:hypothetical protein B0J12DRAFT_684027 [Macrophomina phaseolina]|uniref:Secreted protein n=1 Tax=Macrophomina phaseolina TaxID=35725 RepID=A0ABQ8FUW7_9PEZI|nr:hypothetical protein B0J12DRAFT_684027 [Macrophomina phaseolina]
MIEASFAAMVALWLVGRVVWYVCTYLYCRLACSKLSQLHPPPAAPMRSLFQQNDAKGRSERQSRAEATAKQKSPTNIHTPFFFFALRCPPPPPVSKRKSSQH